MKNFRQKNNNIFGKSNAQGFVVLFTVLISSIVLAIAIGITNVALREVLLSSSAKDAQYAFFAADSGAECGLYWDIRQSAFTQTLQIPNCRGSQVSMMNSSSPYQFSFDTSSTSCAIVTVNKDDPTATKIESLGYNVNCADFFASASNPNPRIVERAIRVTYGPGEEPAPDTSQSTTSTNESSVLSSPTEVPAFDSATRTPTDTSLPSAPADQSSVSTSRTQ